MRVLLAAFTVALVSCTASAAPTRDSSAEECLSALVKAYQAHSHTAEGTGEIGRTSRPSYGLLWRPESVAIACKAFLDAS